MVMVIRGVDRWVERVIIIIIYYILFDSINFSKELLASDRIVHEKE